MTERILDLSECPAKLRVRYSQLVIEREHTEAVSLPLAEVAVVLVSHPQASLTQAVLAGVAAAGGALVACDGASMPVGMMLPLAGHHVQVARFAAQARASLPVRKRLWKQIVRAKVRAQAAVLAELVGADHGLAALAARVGSGDPTNVEARAARRYWKALFGDGFRRMRSRHDENLLLNYGYAVLRAIVGRALCAAGLHPSLGVHHHHRGNAFCLADDLMEPFRPIVDRTVVQSIHQGVIAPAGEDKETGRPRFELTPAVKRALVGPLLGRVILDGQQTTLFAAASAAASSLAAVFLGETGRLTLPDLTQPPIVPATSPDQ